jgi:hypothetical protein
VVLYNKILNMRKFIEFFTGKKERFYLCLTDYYEKESGWKKGFIYSEKESNRCAYISFYAKYFKHNWKRIV